MQTCLSRRASVAVKHSRAAVDFENAFRSERTLVEAARCNGEAQRRIGNFRTEIAAGAENPSPPIELASNFAERLRGFLPGKTGARLAPVSDARIFVLILLILAISAGSRLRQSFAACHLRVQFGNIGHVTEQE